MMPIISLAAIGFLVVATLIGTDLYLGYSLSFDGTTIRSQHIYLAAASLFGIFSAIALNEIRKLNEDDRINVRGLLSAFLRPYAAAAYVTSPLVFFAVIIAYGSGNVGWQEVFMSYQNGFFRETLFKKFQSRE